MKMYEKKEKAVVPRLRFPEFRDAGEWEVKRLGEITNRITGAVGEAALTPVSITANRGFVPQAQKFGRDISGRQYLRYIRLKNGWFAYNRGNSKSFPQGAIYQLIEFQEAAVPNVFYCFEFKSNFVPEFYKGYFQINYHGHQLSKFITSGARGNGLLNIRAEDFFSLELPSPNNRLEQQKIADCLASLDDLIRAGEAQLVALKDHKKGLMQQLFPREGETTPRLRFPEFRDAGEWEVKRLGEVADVYQPETISQSNLSKNGKYLVYGANGIIGRFDSYNHENSQIAITCRGSTCGEVTLTEPQSWITGNSMVVNLDKHQEVKKLFLS